MSLLDRYIGRHVLLSTVVVMVLLLSLFAIFSFLEELTRVGRGHYTTSIAIEYVILLLPGLMYQLFPISALLGSTIGLGLMASHSELTIIRASGVSLGRIIWSVMKIGIVLVILTLIVGETIAPIADQYASKLRSVAISNKLAIREKSELWARDGENFVNIRRILPGKRFWGVFIYERDKSHRIKSIIRAQSAVFRKDRWILENVVSSELNGLQVVTHRQKSRVWNTDLSPDLLNVVTLLPVTMSIRGLYQYIEFLTNNGLDAGSYQHALWNKVAAPFITGVMVFLAIPFVFGPLRSVGIGHRIFVGGLIGIGFYLINQVFTYVGVVYNVNPVVSSFLPASLAFALAYWMMRKVR
jgi:lipopolysaccharide export system permease protein